MKKVKQIHIFPGLFLLAFLANCSSDRKLLNRNDSVNRSEADLTERSLVSIPVSFSSDSQGLSLAGSIEATSYTLLVDTCVSGYSKTFTDEDIKVYKYDLGCLVKLSKVTINSVDYAKADSDYSSFKNTADSAIFKDASDNQIVITIGSTLPTASPGISGDGSETISFSFTEVGSGAEKIVSKGKTGNSNTVSVEGEIAPAFKINSVSFEGIGTSGEGKFKFMLECEESILPSGSEFTIDSTCKGQELNVFKYALVKDTYSGVLTLDQAGSIIDDNPSYVELISVADPHPPGSPTEFFGGFETVELSGPDEMHSNKDMLLVIGANDTSYRYYKVSVEDILSE